MVATGWLGGLYNAASSGTASSPAMDLVVGTLTIAVLVGCAALSNVGPALCSWVLRRQRIRRRTQSCEALASLNNSAALEAASEMFEAFEERSGPTSPRLKKSPSMPILHEMENELLGFSPPQPKRPSTTAGDAEGESSEAAPAEAWTHRRTQSLPPPKPPLPEIADTPSCSVACTPPTPSSGDGCSLSLACDDASSSPSASEGGCISRPKATRGGGHTASLAVADHISFARPIPRLPIAVPSPLRVAVNLATLEDHAVCDEAADALSRSRQHSRTNSEASASNSPTPPSSDDSSFECDAATGDHVPPAGGTADADYPER